MSGRGAKRFHGSVLLISAAWWERFRALLKLRAAPLGGRLMVRLQTLDLRIGVRVPASQPIIQAPSAYESRAYIMVKMARRWGMIGLALAGIAAQASAQERASGIVSGTVVNAATGKPVPGAQVVLRVSYAIYGFRDRLTDRPAAADGARAVTDESGKFTIQFDSSLPASRLFVSREGFRSQANREVVVIPLMPAGQSGITVPLVPQSLVRGRVSDSGGQPLRNITIEAIRVEVQEGRRE